MGHYAAKCEFDDIKNIYSYHTDIRNSKNGIISKIHSIVWPPEVILWQKDDIFQPFFY